MTAAFLPQNRILVPKMGNHSSVKLIGLGGVGSIVARYASVFLASLNQEVRFVLVDGDNFEHSNVSRMLFTDYGNKAAVLRREMLPRFIESTLSLIAIEEFLTPENVSRLVHSGDICLLCVDNHATRKLVNDYCATLPDICLISGGNDGVGPDNSGVVRRGTFGNVQIFIRGSNFDITDRLSHNHPEINNPGDRLPSDQSCTELAVSVPQILFANFAVASAMLNTLWLYLCGCLHYGELAFDIADGVMRPVIPVKPILPKAG
jgi:molybdopterin/thiamine biosynthesis adenylyltransferase